MTDLCDFDNPDMTCPRCGYVAKRLPTYRYCEPVVEQPWRPFLLGDFVERTLATIGVTKDRVQRWTRTEGKPGGCGCASRQKWLNEWGARVQRKVRGWAGAYMKFVLP